MCLIYRRTRAIGGSAPRRRPIRHGVWYRSWYRPERSELYLRGAERGRNPAPVANRRCYTPLVTRNFAGSSPAGGASLLAVWPLSPPVLTIGTLSGDCVLGATRTTIRV